MCLKCNFTAKLIQNSSQVLHQGRPKQEQDLVPFLQQPFLALYLIFSFRLFSNSEFIQSWFPDEPPLPAVQAGVLSLQGRCSTSRCSMSFSRYSQSTPVEKGRCSHNTQLLWNPFLRETGTAQNLTAIKKDQIFMWLSKTATAAARNNSKHLKYLRAYATF